MQDLIISPLRLNEFSLLVKQAVKEALTEMDQAPPATTVKNEFLTRQELCEKYHVSLGTLYNWDKADVLKPYRIGGRILYKAAEVEQAVKQVETVKYKHRRA